jgi:hypothetical protein
MKKEKIKISYQYNTGNLSFLEMYDTLKKLGVKNNKFFLQLHDERLRHLDPLDEENLTLLQKALILKEISHNKWYFLREIVRIPVPGGISPFKLNRGNLAILFCSDLNLNTITMLPRQNYKTVSTCANYLWIYLFGTSNSEILYMNKAFPDSKNNLKRTKDIKDLLPKYILTAVTDTSQDADNMTFIKSIKKNNLIKALPSAFSVDAANKLGRGITSPLLYMDEWAHSKFNQIIYGSAIPALSKARDFAKENNKPHGRTVKYCRIRFTPNENSFNCWKPLRAL